MIGVVFFINVVEFIHVFVSYNNIVQKGQQGYEIYEKRRGEAMGGLIVL